MTNDTKIEFSVSTSNEGSANEQHTILIHKGLDQMAVASLYAKNDMYHAGLEKNYTKLVDLLFMARSIQYSLEAFYKLGQLDEEHWELIMGTVFGRFIDKQRKYVVVEAFVDGRVW